MRPVGAQQRFGGVRGMRYAQACKRIGVVMSTGTSGRKPRGGAINVGIGILTIKLRQDINRLRWCSRIQEFDRTYSAPPRRSYRRIYSPPPQGGAFEVKAR